MANEMVMFNHPQARSVEEQLTLLSPRFAEVLGRTMEPARLIRTIMVSLDRTPKLYECSRQTIFTAAMSAACLGLEVDGATGQAYILPFKGRAQLVTGYKGYNTIAARGSYAIRGAVVREGEGFEFDEPNGVIVHRRKLGNSGRIIGAWARAVSNTLPAHAVVLSIDELMAVMKKAPGSHTSDSPWNDPVIGFPAMCEKTGKRRLSRVMPLNVLPQFGYAARLDEAVEEQGKAARITPERGVEIEEAEEIVSPLPPTQVFEAPIPGDASCAWPDLPPDIAKRAAKFVEFLRSRTSVASIDNAYKHKESVSLRAQVRIASPSDAEKIDDIYTRLRSELQLEEGGK